MTDHDGTPAPTREQRLAKMLIDCRNKFQYYGDLHMAKDPPQRSKALANYLMVDACNRALLGDG